MTNWRKIHRGGMVGILTWAVCMARDLDSFLHVLDYLLWCGAGLLAWSGIVLFAQLLWKLKRLYRSN